MNSFHVRRESQTVIKTAKMEIPEIYTQNNDLLYFVDLRLFVIMTK